MEVTETTLTLNGNPVELSKIDVENYSDPLDSNEKWYYLDLQEAAITKVSSPGNILLIEVDFDWEGAHVFGKLLRDLNNPLQFFILPLGTSAQLTPENQRLFDDPNSILSGNYVFNIVPS